VGRLYKLNAVDPQRLKARGFETGFKTLLSNATCAATLRYQARLIVVCLLLDRRDVARVGLALPGGVTRLLTWTIPAVVDWCF
jgi:hypothetical protein